MTEPSSTVAQALADREQELVTLSDTASLISKDDLDELALLSKTATPAYIIEDTPYSTEPDVNDVPFNPGFIKDEEQPTPEEE